MAEMTGFRPPSSMPRHYRSKLRAVLNLKRGGDAGGPSSAAADAGSRNSAGRTEAGRSIRPRKRSPTSEQSLDGRGTIACSPVLSSSRTGSVQVSGNVARPAAPVVGILKGHEARRNASTRSRGGARARSHSPESHRNFLSPKSVTFRVATRCRSRSSGPSFPEGRSGRNAYPPENLIYGDRPLANLPFTWEESFGGPRILLQAAIDDDVELFNCIVGLVNKSGLGGIDVNAVDSSGRTAISHIAGNGNAVMLETCLKFQGIDPNLPDKEGNSPLHFAAQAGKSECLNILLTRCPNINIDARNLFGYTPLMKSGIQGTINCAKILIFAGANPNMRDYGRKLMAHEWARRCKRGLCADTIERCAKDQLINETTSYRWGSEPELATQILQGKFMLIPPTTVEPRTGSFKSKIRRVFRTFSNTDKSFSLASQLTNAAICASSAALPKPGNSTIDDNRLLRPFNIPQIRITLVSHQDSTEKTKCNSTTGYSEKNNTSITKPPRTKKKSIKETSIID